MRGSVVVGAVMLLLSMPAASQSEPAGTEVWVDPPGDVETEPAGFSGSYANADLLALHVHEDPASFAFTVQLAGVEGDAAAAGGSRLDVVVPLRWGETDFVLRIADSGANALHYTAVLAWHNGSRTETVWQANSWNDDAVYASRAEAWMTAIVPRSSFAAGGATPGPGHVVEIGQVTSTAATTRTGAASIVATDAMPDQDATFEWIVRHGSTHDGPVDLRADIPFRASNGGSGGYLYELELRNLDSHAHTYALQATDTSPELAVVIPLATLELGPQESKRFPVLLETRFGHQHGGFSLATIEAVALDGTATGRAQIGIQYLAIPQPAGHHDTLTFHSREVERNQMATPLLGQGTRSTAYMNAHAEDPLDTQQSLPPHHAVMDAAGTTTFNWIVELDPRLSVGLDFARQDEGLLEAELASPLPMEGRLEGKLVRLHERSSASDTGRYHDLPHDVLGAIPAAAVSLAANAPASIQLELGILDGVDQVVYVDGSDLLLELRLTVTGLRSDTGDYAPHIAPGGTLRLPLEEYREVEEAAFASSLDLHLPQAKRLANAGDVLVVPVEATAATATSIDLEGQSDRVRVEFPQGHTMDLEPGAPDVRNAILYVPDDAQVGDLIPVFFVARSEDVPAVALMHVDITAEEVADDEALAESLRPSGKATPVWWSGVLIVLVAMARRRL